jgi:hypothetical protein
MVAALISTLPLELEFKDYLEINIFRYVIAMTILKIALPSKTQIHKLRTGKKVLIRRQDGDVGFDIDVPEEQHATISKAFMGGKGVHIQLQPQVEGSGLYASGGSDLYASGGSGLYAAGGPQKQVTRRQLHHSVLSDATLALHQADLMSAKLIQQQITARKQTI